MKKTVIIVCLLVFFTTLTSVVSAHNPFTTKPANQHSAVTPIVKNKVFVKIVFWQHQLREKMSGLLREAKSGDDITPLILLCLFAYTYGIVHSAGPGHGKAVALSYIMSCRPSMSTGLAFGNIVAMTHGLSGIALVLTVKFILESGINQSLETMTYVTQILSFSLISLMGLFIVTKGLIGLARKSHVTLPRNTPSPKKHFAAAFAVGLIPCPGVVMVMLFAISLNLTGLGILLGACIAAGMATTITGITLAAMSGKAAALRLTANNTKCYRVLETTIELVAGSVVMILGVTFLLANL